MKKIVIISSSIVVLLIGLIFLVMPFIAIKTKDTITFISYKEDFGRFEENMCYNESYSYYEKLDISISNIEVEKKLFWYFTKVTYEEGNICETEYVLEEEYIDNFLKNAVIKENTNDIDLASLIEGKEAIVGNTRYLGNEYDQAIYYELDGVHTELYVFYVDDLLVIQVGNPDEGSKFIAYK